MYGSSFIKHASIELRGGARCQEYVGKIAQNLLRSSSRIHSRCCIVPHPWFGDIFRFLNSNLSVIEYIIQKRYVSSSIFLYHDVHRDDWITIYHDTWCILSPLQKMFPFNDVIMLIAALLARNTNWGLGELNFNQSRFGAQLCLN